MVTIAQVLDIDNFFTAWLKVKTNDGCAGVDYESIENFEKKLTKNLDLLRSEVMHGSYRPFPLLRVYMQKENDKVRPLSIPAVRDRLLQTAVTLVLTPLLEKEFEKCSFAYRKGFSVKQAVERVVHYREQGFIWVVDADIESFFDEINHNLMLKKIGVLVNDEIILRLIKSWLKCTVRDGDQLIRLKKGVPQGSPISPLLSNLYLDELDEALVNNNQRLVRFADDFLVLCKTKERAGKALEVTEKILDHLKLNINDNKTQIVDFNRGFRFLGVEFIRSLAFKRLGKDNGPLLPEEKRHLSLPTEELKEEVSKDDRDGNEFSQAFQEAIDEMPAHHSIGDYVDGLPDFQLSKKNKPPIGAMGKTDKTFANSTTLDGLKSDELALEESEFEVPEFERPKFEEPQSGHDPRLRTLYLMEHGCELSKESERLVVEKDDKRLVEIPAIKVDQVLVFGNSQITTPVMKFCLNENIPIALLSAQGRYCGVIDNHSTDSVLLHRDQFKRAEDDVFCLQLAKAMVIGKLSNSRLVLSRQARKRNNEKIKIALEAIKKNINKISDVTTLDEVRGYEGHSAKVYFAAMGELLRESVGDKWVFSGRKRQPPPDPVNALLSFGYTLLFYNVYSLMRARGLNPHVGFLHPIRQGHPALVSDIMEEFRSIVVDSLVLNLLLNQQLNQQLKPEQFTVSKEEGSCYLNNEARKLFINAFEKKMNAPLTHPITGLHLDYRRCIETQIKSVASLIRGHSDVYQAVVLR